MIDRRGVDTTWESRPKVGTAFFSESSQTQYNSDNLRLSVATYSIRFQR